MLIMFKPKAMTQQDRPTAKEMLDLIKRLPDSKSHIHICCITGKHCVTNEFFAGAFAGRAFEGNTYEEDECYGMHIREEAEKCVNNYLKI